MGDQTTNGASVSPEITSKAPKPPGILPKNAQTWAMAAIAVLMVTVIAFSSGPTPKAKTGDANSRATRSSIRTSDGFRITARRSPSRLASWRMSRRDSKRPNKISAQSTR